MFEKSIFRIRDLLACILSQLYGHYKFTSDTLDETLVAIVSLQM